jgi:glucosamine--fructose-6-phosphate aminotransferase (isomerizing)
MCGICGYLGSDEAVNIILNSLHLLLNRGYDSAGICTLDKNSNLIVNKYASTVTNTAISLLENSKEVHNGNNIGIAHTRWATHGAKTNENAHPHLDSKNEIAVVHNGIIENYLEIKNELKDDGLIFVSETDTEVIAKLLENKLKNVLKQNNYDHNCINFEKDVLRPCIEKLEGTWALLILFKYTPNKIYLAKNGSPLVLGYNDKMLLISSEQLPLSKYFNNYITLDDGDIITVEKDMEGNIILPKVSYVEKQIENKLYETSCKPFAHWTIKEIYEQSISVQRTLNMGGRILDDYNVKLGGLENKKDVLLQCENIILLGCGTSLNSANIGCKIIKKLKCMNTVNCFDASEFILDDIPLKGKTCFILLSQSGETKDLQRHISQLHELDYPIVSIVNVVGSTISRESDCGIYLNAGREVGVASTKSFTCQVVALSLLAIWFSQNKNTCCYQREQIIKNLRTLPNDIEYMLNNDLITFHIKDIAKRIYNKSIFILGKDSLKYIADEGALKIKELTYMHCESYAAGSLKHGPFAQIDENTVIILLAPKDKYFNKMLNTAQEVKSRNARVIMITNNDVKNSYDSIFEDVIYVPYNKTFNTITHNIPLQLLAYEIAILKGINVDFPKNLAKSVTVL